MNAGSAKETNEKLLISLGVQINVHLPCIESPQELKPRTAREIATRSLVLSYVIGIGYGQPGGRMKEMLQRFELDGHCSPKELKLLESVAPTKQEQINCVWLAECVQALAWCMGMVDLDLLKQCDDSLASRLPLSRDPNQFISEASLRPFDEIYNQADLHYRAHWAARNARLTGKSCPLNLSIIMERRKALDWAVGVPDDWDEIDLST